MKIAARYKNAANSGFAEELMPMYRPHVVSTSYLEGVGNIVLFRDMSACLLTIEKELEVFDIVDDFARYLVQLVHDKPHLEENILRRIDRLAQAR